MNAFRRSSSRIQGRMRRTAEILIDDLSLRSNLTDTQAKRLLDWGLARVKDAAMDVADLSDEDAYPALEEKVVIVRQLMRTVDRLMGPPDDSPGMAPADHIDLLLNSLPRLTGQATSPALVAYGEFLGSDWPDQEAEVAFQLLMDLVDLASENVAEEE